MQYGISFDFWNTLFGNGPESHRHKLRIQYFHRIITNYKKYRYKTVAAVFDASLEFFVNEWQKKQRTPTPRERIKYMTKILAVDINDDDIDKIAHYFGNLIFQIPPQDIPSVHKVVAQLSNKYPLGIISDTGYISGIYIRRFLEKEKMLSFFQSLLFSDEQINCKPHSSVFLLTCDNLGVDPSELIHIGDLEKTDVEGAKNSGCISIKFTGIHTNPSSDSHADYIIDNYEMLPKLIDTIVNS